MLRVYRVWQEETEKEGEEEAPNAEGTQETEGETPEGGQGTKK